MPNNYSERGTMSFIEQGIHVDSLVIGNVSEILGCIVSRKAALSLIMEKVNIPPNIAQLYRVRRESAET